MKALISTTETFTLSWVTSWEWIDPTQNQPGYWKPKTTESIENCQRVAQVEFDDKIFPVYNTLFWVDCPDNCIADYWYYKDEIIAPKPQDAPQPKEIS